MEIRQNRIDRSFQGIKGGTAAKEKRKRALLIFFFQKTTVEENGIYNLEGNGYDRRNK